MNIVQEELLSEGFRTSREEIIEEGLKEYFQRKILPILLGSSLIAGVAGLGGTVMKYNIGKTKENIQRLIELKGAGNGKYSFTVAGKPAEYSEQTHLLKLNGKVEELGGGQAQNIAESWMPPEERLKKAIEKLAASTEHTTRKLKTKVAAKAMRNADNGEGVESLSNGELDQAEKLEYELDSLKSLLRTAKAKKKFSREQLADFRRELKRIKKQIKTAQRSLGGSILRGLGFGVLCRAISAVLSILAEGDSSKALYKGIRGGVAMGAAGFAVSETNRREAIANRPDIEEEVFSY